MNAEGVELSLGDNVFILKPTLKALRKINREAGSLLQAMTRVKEVDSGIIVAIVAAGTDTQQGPAMDKLEELLIAHGFLTAVGPVGDYLATFMEGTKSAETEPPPGKD